MKSIIPDRWLDYESVGKQIGTTPFIAFKVPLKKYFFTEELSPEQKFGPSELIEKLPNLSLVIDLTNTKKYYDSNDFRENGIEYEKIFCPGHEIPRNDLIHKFFDIVDNFIKKKDKSDDMYLIGVHCTHGINRTGFFICSYMINKLGYKSENAISEFNLARGHSIERRNYLNALERYDLYPLRFPTKRARDYSYNRRKGTDNGRNESYFESNRYLRNERSRYVCDFNHPRFERGYRNHVQNSRFFPNNSYSRNEVTQNRHHRYTSLPSNSHNSREIGNPASTTTNHSPYH